MSEWIRATSETTATDLYEPWLIDCPYEDCSGDVTAWGAWNPEEYCCPLCDRRVDFAVSRTESDL